MGNYLILVEARGAFFRPLGSGDFQPALYNSMQAYKLARDLIAQGNEPFLRLIIDMGLSIEEYSPTGKFIADRNNIRNIVVNDFRERHGIVYGSQPPLDSSQTNSATYRFVSDVRDSKDNDLSSEEIKLAKNLRSKPYSEFEIIWWRHFLVNSEFLQGYLGVERDIAKKLLERTSFKVYPLKNTTDNFSPLERDYFDSLRHYMERGSLEWVNTFLRVIGLNTRRLKTRKELCLQMPIDGHVTSYFDTRIREISKRVGIGYADTEEQVSSRQRDRLGFSGRQVTIPFEQFIKTVTAGTSFVTSYPLAFAHQVIDGNFVSYIPRGEGGPSINTTNLEGIYLIAERADPNSPELDQMHKSLIDQLATMTRQKLTILSFPTNRLIDPEIIGRTTNPREIAKSVWDELAGMEYPGVFIIIPQLSNSVY